MKRRNEAVMLSLMLGFIVAILAQAGEASLLVAPLWFVGNGLRYLSLSGAMGNVIAWAVVIIVTAVPLGYFGLRKLHRQLIGADKLLLILAIQLGAFLYFLVNPTLTDYAGDLPMSDGFALIYLWALVSTTVGYAFLRLLHRVDGDATSGRLLPKLLTFGGMLMVGLSGYSELAVLIHRTQNVMDSNTGDVNFTIAVLAVLALCSLVPSVLGGMTLLWSGDVADALMNEPYSEETIELCAKVAGWCNLVAVSSVLVSVVCNLVQVLLASRLYQVNITVEVPLLTLLLSSALYLLCHHMQGAKELSDDNDSII